jgi:hypothetical protein
MSTEFIGNDRKAWERYKAEHGEEAYRYRRLYEEVARQLMNLYIYAEEKGIELPSPGNES